MSRPTARKEKIQGTEMTAATQHSLHTKDLVHEILRREGLWTLNTGAQGRSGCPSSRSAARTAPNLRETILTRKLTVKDWSAQMWVVIEARGERERGKKWAWKEEGSSRLEVLAGYGGGANPVRERVPSSSLALHSTKTIANLVPSTIVDEDYGRRMWPSWRLHSFHSLYVMWVHHKLSKGGLEWTYTYLCIMQVSCNICNNLMWHFIVY